MTAPATAIRFDVRDPAFIGGDRVEEYRRLRNEEPVARLGPGGTWVVARYADCARLLLDRSTRKRPPQAPVPPALGDGPAARMYRATMAVNDPPDHTRMRGLVGSALTPRALRAMSEQIQAIVDRCLDEAVARGEVEGVDAIARRVPMTAICRILGIPEADWPDLASWTGDFIRMFFAEGQPAEALERCHRACQSFFDYFGALADARRRDPRDDLTTALVQAELAGETLSRDELLGTLRSLLTGGHETVMGLLGTMLAGLAAQPGMLGWLRADSERIPNAVEEFLRFEAPIQAERRLLGQTTQVAGVTLREGDQAWLLLGSANRDERRFEDPDTLDLGRAGIQHLSFGGGIHFCAGSALARLEARAVLAGLARRVRRIDIVTNDPVRRRADFLFPVHEHLPLMLSPL